MSTSMPITNFSQAEFHGDPPPPDRCAYCQRGIETQYYRVDGNMACPTCAQRAQSLIPPDSHKAYSRAVVFGIGAAILGCLGYALIEIVTGWTIGYAAIGVGYLVAIAMMKGSGGLGGKRYQITAALLTYAAVAMAFIPMVMYDASKKTDAKPAVTAQQTPAVDGTTTTPAAKPDAKNPLSLGGLIVKIGLVLGLGLVSPFLVLVDSPGGGLLGLFIIFIGISAAWRKTARVASAVDGPYQQTPSAATP